MGPFELEPAGDRTLVAFQDIIQPTNTVFFFSCPSSIHGERTQTYFNVVVHMTMVSEAWEATELCNKWYK